MVGDWWSVAGAYRLNQGSCVAHQDNAHWQNTTDGTGLTTNNQPPAPNHYFLLRDREGFAARPEEEVPDVAEAAFAFITCGLISSTPAARRIS